MLQPLITNGVITTTKIKTTVCVETPCKNTQWSLNADKQLLSNVMVKVIAVYFLFILNIFFLLHIK